MGANSNCWEFLNCPSETRSQCPAHPQSGKKCWEVDNTLCKGQTQGTAADKKEFCYFDCGFVANFAFLK
jgi:hypothetical protein